MLFSYLLSTCPAWKEAGNIVAYFISVSASCIYLKALVLGFLLSHFLSF